jgi:hypothetical protein
MPVSADYITSQKSNSQPHLNFEPKAKKEKELPKRAGEIMGRTTEEAKEDQPTTSTRRSRGETLHNDVMSLAHLVPVMEDGVYDGDDVGLGREVLHPQHPLELLHDDDGGGAAHEPGDRRPRQEIH